MSKCLRDNNLFAFYRRDNLDMHRSLSAGINLGVIYKCKLGMSSLLGVDPQDQSSTLDCAHCLNTHSRQIRTDGLEDNLH